MRLTGGKHFLENGKRAMKDLWLHVTVMIALACASCGSSNNLHPVSGKVLYKGAPAVNATIFLRRQGVDPLNQQAIMGIVQEDGGFTLVCESFGKGAPPGEYDVLIEWKHDPKVTRTGSNARPTPDRLKGRYANPIRPRFHVTIKPGPNELAPFELAD
jgi:hypothetical protein